MLGMFENRVLMRISETKRQEISLGCRKMGTVVFSDLYSSPNIIRMVK